MSSQSVEKMLLALKAVDQIILEMTYMSKGKTLTINRRVSLNFRDNALYEVFKHSLSLLG